MKLKCWFQNGNDDDGDDAHSSDDDKEEEEEIERKWHLNSNERRKFEIKLHEKI